MSLRIWISPVLQPQTNVFKSGAEAYCTGGFVNFFPSLLTGLPATTFVLTVGRAADWTAADADATLELVIAVPNSIDDVPSLISALRTSTVANLTTAQRTRMQAVFDNHAIPRSDFTLTTSLSKVFRRLVSFLFENDEGFGLGFQF